MATVAVTAEEHDNLAQVAQAVMIWRGMRQALRSSLFWLGHGRKPGYLRGNVENGIWRELMCPVQLLKDKVLGPNRN